MNRYRLILPNLIEIEPCHKPGRTFSESVVTQNGPAKCRFGVKTEIFTPNPVFSCLFGVQKGRTQKEKNELPQLPIDIVGKFS